MAKALWWMFAVPTGAFCALLPFLWRSRAGLFLSAPFVQVLGFALLAIMFVLAARQKSLWPWRGVTGLVMIGLGMVIGVSSNGLARRIMFEFQYPRYVEMVSMTRRGLIPEGPFPAETAKYLNVSSGEYDGAKGLIEVHTICGATFETTIYSVEPIAGRSDLQEIKKGEPGHFYFVWD